MKNNIFVALIAILVMGFQNEKLTEDQLRRGNEIWKIIINSARMNPQIQNPDLIYPNWQLKFLFVDNFVYEYKVIEGDYQWKIIDHVLKLEGTHGPLQKVDVTPQYTPVPQEKNKELLPSTIILQEKGYNTFGRVVFLFLIIVYLFLTSCLIALGVFMRRPYSVDAKRLRQSYQSIVNLVTWFGTFSLYGGIILCVLGVFDGVFHNNWYTEMYGIIGILIAYFGSKIVIFFETRFSRNKYLRDRKNTWFWILYQFGPRMICITCGVSFLYLGWVNFLNIDMILGANLVSFEMYSFFKDFSNFPIMLYIKLIIFTTIVALLYPFFVPKKFLYMV